MKKKTYMLFIIALLQMGLVCNYQLACAETLSAAANHPIKKQSLGQPEKPIIDSNKQVDSNQSVIPKGTDSSRLSNEELQAKIYKEAVECFRREMDSYKFILYFALGALTAIIGLAGVCGGIKVFHVQKEVNKTEEKVEEINPWSKAGTAYAIGHYEEAANIWSQIYDKFKPNTRQFFNNWGSSLLN